MGMDIMVIPTPMSENGNSCIMLFTDYYTKWVEAFAMPDSEATTVAQKLIQGILCRHGAPERIISDRGPNFTSDVFKEVTEMLGMKQSLTSGYHPQADGQAERNIGTLTRTISKMVESNQRNWDVISTLCFMGLQDSSTCCNKGNSFLPCLWQRANKPS